MLLNNSLNRRTADALCTVIAIGFLAKDSQREVKSNFLFHGQADQREVERLSVLMRGSNIDNIGHLCPVFEAGQVGAAGENKQSHPFIYAWRDGFDSAILQTVIDERMSEYIAILERTLTDIDLNLRGAYIGGVADINSVRLLVPSILYQYPIPDYVNNGGNYIGDIAAHYRSSLDTTNTIFSIFQFFIRELGVPEVQFPATIEDYIAIVNSMPQQIGNNRAFASVHGLITSMTEAPPDQLEEGNINVELALSGGTVKVASCLPCAIFAMSQEAPASYTHLGRGDYWNLPQNCNLYTKERWRNFVNECYMEGIELLMNYLPAEWYNFFVRLNQEYAEGNHEYIPDVFLLALTFQSAFVDKMIRTIESINRSRGML